jgi:glycosyltransferase involved in cell wall biosynthesis
MTPAHELSHVMEAYEAVERWGAHVVHDHTVTGPVWAQVHARVPVITTNHGPFEESLRSIYRRVAPTIPVIAISHHQASTASDVRVRHVIHHGLDTDAVPVGAGRSGYAVFLGRMDPSKGVDRAIDVARRAQMPLKIAAKMREADEIEYFEHCVKPLLGPAVEYVGEIGPEDKYALLGGATCLLNPIAWAEPFGMVMIEALACGTPVVATPHGAVPELIDDGVTGYVRHDRRGLVRALRDVADLDRGKCRIVAEQRFSMQRMAADHAEAYRALVHRDQAEIDELSRMLVPLAGDAASVASAGLPDASVSAGRTGSTAP